MFGLNKKRIPGPDEERHALICQIIRNRLGDDDPICANLGTLPIPALKLTAEAAILFIVEQFLTICTSDVTEQQAVELLNEAHAAALAAGGMYLSMLDGPATLFEYVRHYIDERFASSGPYADAFLADAIQIVKSYYGR